MAEHANVRLIERLNLLDLDASAALFADDFVWHYINPNLPELPGDYIGLDGLQRFFGAISQRTHGRFRARPISAMACGDELLVTHTRNSMDIDDRSIMLDAVVVWRVVDGRLVEAWDIPAAFAVSDATSPPKE